MSETKKVFYGIAFGKVQGVLFRRTLMIAAHKRGIMAGVSNDRVLDNKVIFTLWGPTNAVDELVSILKSEKPLNSLGAQCQNVIEETTGELPLSHEYNTEDKQCLEEKEGVEFYY